MNVKKVEVEVHAEVLRSHGFVPQHFSACIVAKGGRSYGSLVTDKCGHQHLSRPEAEKCLPSMVPTPLAIGISDGTVHVLVPAGGIW